MSYNWNHLYSCSAFSFSHTCSLYHLAELIYHACLSLLKVKGVSNGEPKEDRHLLLHASTNAPVVEAPVEINRVNVALLFVAAILYDFAVGGAIEVLGAFVLKAPLSWNATLVSFLPPFL